VVGKARRFVTGLSALDHSPYSQNLEDSWYYYSISQIRVEKPILANQINFIELSIKII